MSEATQRLEPEFKGEETRDLPATGFLRLTHIIGNPKSNPPILPIIPVGSSTWWQGVKDGRFPPAVKLGPNITAWRTSDIRKLVNQISNQAV